MTATVLQFPRPAVARQTTPEKRQPCEIISLSNWRLKAELELAVCNIIHAPIRAVSRASEFTAS
ncbi:MAG: hypothetical protein LJE68_15955 [Rhodobacter sp.]|nr:hypothetical protein [Rhodobacter sp.]